MPKVSVYLSSYNHEAFLKESIDSVLNQTYQGFELFIVDDASSDNSWSIIERYQDPRIHAFRNKINRNDKTMMRKVIYEMAAGDYIAVQHSDNIWHPEKLQKQVDYLESHPKIGAVFTKVQLITDSGQPFTDNSHQYYNLFNQPNRNRFEWLNFFYNQCNALCHPSVLIRKKCHDVCGFYRAGFNQLPDFDMWVRLCLKYEIYILDEKLIKFRILENEQNQGAQRPENRIRAQFEYFQIIKNFLQISSFQDLVRVFPEAKPYYRMEGGDIGFVIAYLAVDKPGQPFKKLFGLNQLFEMFNDPQRAERIQKWYGFTHKDFIKLTGQLDIFSVEIKAKLRDQLSRKIILIRNKRANMKQFRIKIAKKNKRIRKLHNRSLTLRRKLVLKNRRLSRLNQQMEKESRENYRLKSNNAQLEQQIYTLSENLVRMQTSKILHYGTLTLKAFDTLAPPNSLRERILKGIYKGLLRPIIGAKDRQELRKLTSITKDSKLFDQIWYLDHNPDVAASKMDPLKHYLLYGGFEGRDPGPDFSSTKYLEAYEDVRLAGVNPLVHYLKYGKDEGRSIFPHQS